MESTSFKHSLASLWRLSYCQWCGNMIALFREIRTMDYTLSWVQVSSLQIHIQKKNEFRWKNPCFYEAANFPSELKVRARSGDLESFCLILNAQSKKSRFSAAMRNTGSHVFSIAQILTALTRLLPGDKCCPPLSLWAKWGLWPGQNKEREHALLGTM